MCANKWLIVNRIICVRKKCLKPFNCMQIKKMLICHKTQPNPQSLNSSFFFWHFIYFLSFIHFIFFFFNIISFFFFKCFPTIFLSVQCFFSFIHCFISVLAFLFLSFYSLFSSCLSLFQTLFFYLFSVSFLSTPFFFLFCFLLKRLLLFFFFSPCFTFILTLRFFSFEYVALKFTDPEDKGFIESPDQPPTLKYELISCLGSFGKWVTTQSDLQVCLTYIYMKI